MVKNALDVVRRLLSLVKIEHTLFALPLAFTGTVLASRGLPDLRVLLLVAVAFTGARTAAMAFNRLVDRGLDATNPRTAQREIPLGLVSIAHAGGLLIFASGVFFAAAWGLNDACFRFSPLVLALLLGYSYTKRFTWLCHLILGVCLGMAPLAGWLAVTGTFAWPPLVLGLGVTFWVAGFDIMYACQDVEFDKKAGLHSVPVRLGSAKGLSLAAAAHLFAFCLFVLAGYLAGVSWPFYVLSLITGGLLAWEHGLVRADDLSRLDTAFFTVNSMVSFSLLLSVWFGLAG